MTTSNDEIEDLYCGEGPDETPQVYVCIFEPPAGPV